ncbi:MAG TPA: hypothetical protein VJ183_11405 [Chloroflexia bacterium]|nr:hypothetical protein [Chloroflexia bacterium]
MPSFNKTDLIIATITLIVGGVLAVLVELFSHDLGVALFVGLASMLIGFAIDIKFSIHEFMVKAQNSTLQAYEKFRKDKCPLFSKVAQEKWSETEAFFQNLTSDVLLIEDIGRVYQILEFLFCDTDSIQEIYATSYGEMDEWTDAGSWWGENYLEIHERAANRGVRLHRIFIHATEAEMQEIVPVIDKNITRNVSVRTAVERRVSARDLAIAGNCLIFTDSHRRPIYVLQATHDKSGHFMRAEIFRDDARMDHIIQAYNGISNVSTPYRDPSQPMPGRESAA